MFSAQRALTILVMKRAVSEVVTLPGASTRLSLGYSAVTQASTTWTPTELFLELEDLLKSLHCPNLVQSPPTGLRGSPLQSTALDLSLCVLYPQPHRELLRAGLGLTPLYAGHKPVPG